MDIYSHWLRQAFPQPRQRQQYFKSLIDRKPISHANFRLAHLLAEKLLATLVVTPNFDNFLSRALTLFGEQPIVCDHPATTERIDPESPDIQIIHVHGTYWFYDLCNLPGEIKDRSSDTPLRAVTMLSLLYDILARHSAIVIGYSGWEDDVIMTALRRRLSAGLPTNLYWFCFRRADADSLPTFLKNHDNVCVVLPARTSKQTSEPRRPADDEKLAKAPTEVEPTLPAKFVLDKLVGAFTKENPSLTSDPIGFFAKQLTDSFPQDQFEKSDDDIYRLRDVIRRVEQAKKTGQHKPVTVEAAIERATNAVRRSSYADAIKTANRIKLNQLSVAQRKTLIDLVMSSALGLNDNSKEEQNGYDLVLRLASGRVATRKEVRRQIATALLNKGFILSQANRLEEEIQSYDELLRRLGDATEPELQESLARALFYKGATLGQVNRAEEEIRTYDELLDRFGDSTDLALRETIAQALVNKGAALGRLDRNEEAMQAYDQVQTRFNEAPEPPLREQVALSLLNKGIALSQLARREEEVQAYEEIVRRFGESEDQTLREAVAKALVNKGLTLGQLKQSEQAIETYDEVLRRVGEADELGLREATARALFNKGIILTQLERDEQAALT